MTPLGEITIDADVAGQDELLAWTHSLEGSEEIRFALEDCRHVNGRLERFLLTKGVPVLRVPPKLMAGAHQSTRTRGKSDAIDALAIARSLSPRLERLGDILGPGVEISGQANAPGERTRFAPRSTRLWQRHQPGDRLAAAAQLDILALLGEGDELREVGLGLADGEGAGHGA